MSKFLKRTFALALILCMVLSVIPAVSADFPAANTVVYNFAGAYNNGTKISAPNGVTKDLYESGALFADANSEKPLNWYYLKEARDTDATFSNGGIYENEGVWDWIALVIYVPAEGNYDAVVEVNCSGNGDQEGVFTLVEMATNPNVVNVSGTGKNKFQGGAYTTALVSSVDFSQRNTSGAYAGYAYMGNIHLNEGFYVFGMQKNSTSDGSCQKTLKKLMLTKDSTSSFVDLINAHDSNPNESYRAVYQLTTDLNAPNAELVLKNAEVNLRGNKLTVGNVTAYDGTMQFKQEATPVYPFGIQDPSGKGTVVASSIEMPEGSTYLPATVGKDSNDATKNVYKFFKAGTDLTTVFCTEPKDRPDAAAGSKSFGFDIGMAAEAYGWDLSNMSVKLEVMVNGSEVLGECNYTQDMFNEWKADKANNEKDTVFYVDVLNYAELAGAQLMFRVTVTSNSVDYVITPTYTVA